MSSYFSYESVAKANDQSRRAGGRVEKAWKQSEFDGG